MSLVRHGEVLTETAPLSFFGLRIGTRMTVLALRDGSLLVHSPIKLDDEIKAAVEAHGPIRHLVCPNVFHHLHAGGWATEYKDAVVYAPRGLRKKRADLRIDRELEDVTSETFGGELVPLHIDGCMLDETVFVHPASKTVISADLTENFPGSDHWFTSLYLKAGGIDGRPGWNRLMRFVYRDRRAARKSVDALLEHDFTRAIIAHGDVIDRDAKDIVRATFEFLG